MNYCCLQIFMKYSKQKLSGRGNMFENIKDKNMDTMVEYTYRISQVFAITPTNN